MDVSPAPPAWYAPATANSAWQVLDCPACRLTVRQAILQDSFFSSGIPSLARYRTGKFVCRTASCHVARSVALSSYCRRPTKGCFVSPPRITRLAPLFPSLPPPGEFFLFASGRIHCRSTHSNLHSCWLSPAAEDQNLRAKGDNDGLGGGGRSHRQADALSSRKHISARKKNLVVFVVFA